MAVAASLQILQCPQCFMPVAVLHTIVDILKTQPAAPEGSKARLDVQPGMPQGMRPGEARVRRCWAFCYVACRAVCKRQRAFFKSLPTQLS